MAERSERMAPAKRGGAMVTTDVVTTARALPAVQELPLLGSLHAYNRDRLGFLLALARSCGDAARFHFGPFPAVFFNTPELVHSVLVAHAHDFETGMVRYNAFHPIIGDGLFV